jgi:hypothetical protein
VQLWITVPLSLQTLRTVYQERGPADAVASSALHSPSHHPSAEWA